jgi:hypothetical protein
MSIQKFRTLEDAERALHRTPPDPDNLLVLARLSRTILRVAGWRRRSGVFKYRSIEEADAAREAETAERMTGIRAAARPSRRT